VPIPCFTVRLGLCARPCPQRKYDMNWKSSGAEQNEDTDALKKQLHAEGFDAYE